MASGAAPSLPASLPATTARRHLMTLLEEVLAAAPPAYSGAGSSASTLLLASAPGRLPTQLWLAILAHVVEPRAGRRQSVAGWAALHRSVRFVCKELYLGACCLHRLARRMH